MNDLSAVAQAVLDAALAGWPVGHPDRPETSYVEHVGRPNPGPQADGGCSRLVVHVTGLVAAGGDAPTGPRAASTRNRVPQRPALAMVVTLQRCGTPQVGLDGNGQVLPIPAGDVDAYAKARLDDLQRLWTGLLGAWRGATLAGAPGTGEHRPGEQVQWGQAVPLGPDGGIAGWQIPLVVTI